MHECIHVWFLWIDECFQIRSTCYRGQQNVAFFSISECCDKAFQFSSDFSGSEKNKNIANTQTIIHIWAAWINRNINVMNCILLLFVILTWMKNVLSSRMNKFRVKKWFRFWMLACWMCLVFVSEQTLLTTKPLLFNPITLHSSFSSEPFHSLSAHCSLLIIR